MKTQALSWALVLVLVLVLVAAYPILARQRECLTGRDRLREEMRRLWFDHVDRTHHFIISALAGLPDTAAVAAHLHANQDQIAGAFGKYYGRRAAAALAALLHEHIDLAARLVEAHKAGGQTAAALAAWRRNADALAAFLSRASPRWPYPAARAMMYAHLDATAAVLRARLRGDWPAAVRLYDRVVDQALHMADVLAEGLGAEARAG